MVLAGLSDFVAKKKPAPSQMGLVLCVSQDYLLNQLSGQYTE